MLLSVIKWINGYIILKIEKGSPERFFNVCRKRNIYIWDITIDDNNYYFKIKLEDYRKINDIAYKCKTYPKQTDRVGFPFVLYMILKKRTLLPAFIFFMITLYYLSGFIWDINVSGQSRYTKEALIEYMETVGLKKYMRLNKLNADSIEKQMRIDYKDIGWVSVSLEGTNAFVKILESDMPADNNLDKIYSDIIASDNGVIESIVTRSGVPKVHVGDRVKKGQVLVSGVVDLYNDSGEIYEKKPVMADADILLQTIKKYKKSFSMIYDKKYYTGRKKTEYTICSEKFIVFIENILNKFESYEKYDIINETMFNNLLSKKIMLEYEIVGKTYTNDEAVKKAASDLNNYIKNIILDKTEILDKSVTVRIRNGVCRSNGWIDMLKFQNERKIITNKDWGVEQKNEYIGNNN